MSEDFKKEADKLTEPTEAIDLHKKIPNSFEQFVLGMDRYINQKYQAKAESYGWFAGIASFLLFFYLSAFMSMPPEYFAFIIIISFPIGFLFVKGNAWSWGLRFQKDPLTNELVRDPISKEAMRDCGCNLKRLPLYGEDNWLAMRLTEHYTCLIYKFITRFILGWYLIVVLVLVLLFIFK